VQPVLCHHILMRLITDVEGPFRCQIVVFFFVVIQCTPTLALDSSQRFTYGGFGPSVSCFSQLVTLAINTFALCFEYSSPVRMIADLAYSGSEWQEAVRLIERARRSGNHSTSKPLPRPLPRNAISKTIPRQNTLCYISFPPDHGPVFTRATLC